MPDPFRSRVARSPGADVRLWQLESQARHSLIFAKSTIFWYLAVSSARKRAMSTFRGAMVEPDSSSFLRNSGVCKVSLSAVRSLARMGARQPRRRHQCEPDADVHVLQLRRLCECRNVRRSRRPALLRHPQRDHLAAADMRQPAGQHEHPVLDGAAHEVDGQRRHAPIRDVRHEQSPLLLDHLPRQVQCRSDSGAAVTEPPRLGFDRARGTGWHP